MLRIDEGTSTTMSGNHGSSPHSWHGHFQPKRVPEGVMAALQRFNINIGITLFGHVSAACFFVPGWQYYRQRTRDARSQ